jgi:hypothetical protein
MTISTSSFPRERSSLARRRRLVAAAFGQQRRMAVVFHRLIMPDGYSVDLDQFHGLDQIGEEGLKDKVNNHYFEIFGASIALGVIAGAAEITQGGGTISTSGSQAFTTGARQRLAVSKHYPGSLHADTAHHHDSRRPPREGLFHAGHALACVYSADVLRRFPNALIVLCWFARSLAGCKQGTSATVAGQYNAETQPMQGVLQRPDNRRSSADCEGERDADEEMATNPSQPVRKERDARCKPQADHLAELQADHRRAAVTTCSFDNQNSFTEKEEIPMRQFTLQHHSRTRRRHCSRRPRPVRLRHRLRPHAIRPCHRADRARRTVHCQPAQQIENGTKIFTNTVKIATTACKPTTQCSSSTTFITR